MLGEILHNPSMKPLLTYQSETFCPLSNSYCKLLDIIFICFPFPESKILGMDYSLFFLSFHNKCSINLYPLD